MTPRAPKSPPPLQCPRVLELVHSLERGGRTVRIVEGARSLRQHGAVVEVGVFSPPPDWFFQRWPDVPVRVFPKPERLSAAVISRIYRYLREHRTQIVHAHSEDAYLYGGSAARLAGIPIIGTVHRSDPDSFRPTAASAIWNRLLTHQVAVSNHRRQWLTEALGAPADRVSVIPGGVDVDRYRPVSAEERERARAGLRLPTEGPVLLSMGHLGAIKGHDITLQAMPAILSAFPPARLYIAGDGTDTDWKRVRYWVERFNLTERVTLLGQIHNPEQWFAACDLFIQPCREEAFGLVFAEAAASGRAVVSTRVGGIPEIVTDGETGLLVAPERPDEVSSAALRLLNEPDLRQAMERKARLRAEACFTLENMALAYLTLARRLFGEPATSAAAATALPGCPTTEAPSRV